MGLVVVVVATYRFLFDLGSLAHDTFPLVASARVSGADDVATILTERMMHGTGFPETTLFYRPVASLSHSVDYAVWGLNLGGHHASNVLVHAAASLLVAGLYLQLADGSLPGATLAGGVFALHPSMASTVSAIPHRQDMLAGVFGFAGLLLAARWLDHEDPPWGWPWWVAGLFVLALGGKEIAVAFPVLFGALALIRSTGDGLVARVRDAAGVLAPTGVLVGAWFAWRAAVLDSVLGGYATKRVLEWAGGYPQAWVAIVTKYVTDLVPGLGLVQLVGGLPMAHQAVLVAGLLGLAGLAAWRALDWSKDAWRARVDEAPGLVLCWVWIGLGAALFLVTLTYAPRSAYTFTAPVAILLATAAVRVVGTSKRPGLARLRSATGPGLRVGLVLVLLVPAGAGIGALSEDRWEARSTYNDQVLAALGDHAGTVDPQRAAVVTNYTSSFGANDTWTVLPWDGGLRGYSVNAWLELTDRPPFNQELTVEHGPAREQAPAGVEVEASSRGETVELTLVSRPRGG